MEKRATINKDTLSVIKAISVRFLAMHRDAPRKYDLERKSCKRFISLYYTRGKERFQ